LSDQVKPEGSVSGCRHISPDSSGTVKAPQRKNGRETHAVNRVKAALSTVHARKRLIYDTKSAIGRANIELRDNLHDALGGFAACSPQQLLIVDAIVRTAMLLNVADGFLAKIGDKVVNQKYKRMAPIVSQRMQLSDAIVKYLVNLGLERIPKPVPRALDYAASLAAGDAP
jgi:hypothetical protein